MAGFFCPARCPVPLGVRLRYHLFMTKEVQEQLIQFLKDSKIATRQSILSAP